MAARETSSFTGRRRDRKTSWVVQFGDVASKWIITIGGLSTIVAVLLVCVSLVSVVLPMFTSAEIEEPQVVVRGADAPPTPADDSNADAADTAPQPAAPAAIPAGFHEGEPIHVDVDEYLTLMWSVTPDGTLRLYRRSTSELLQEPEQLFDDRTLTAWSFDLGTDAVAFGFDDGSVQIGRIGFDTHYLELADLDEDKQHLKAGETVAVEGGLGEVTPLHQVRVQTLVVELDDPIKTGSDAPVSRIDLVETDNGPVYVVLTEDAALRYTFTRERENIMTGEITRKVYRSDMPYEPRDGAPPIDLLVSARGDKVYLAYADGTLVRYDTGNTRDINVVERLNVLKDTPGRTVTSMRFLLGRSTLLVGDSQGDVTAWFLVEGSSEMHATSDGSVLVKAHTLVGNGSPVTALATSSRMRMIAAGHEDGTAQLYYVTSQKNLGSVRVPGGAGALHALTIAPRADGLLAGTEEGIVLWPFDPRHPEVTFQALFGKVWYETYPEPAYVWQSVGGTDEFEPKYSLMPLMFGTIKATVYSMLFAVPLALLAAIYTSEFMHPKVKAKVKPTIEMMASLPSVVLGFLAGLWFAQVAEDIVPAVLISIITIPAAFLVGAYIWQLLPQDVSLRMARYRLLFVMLTLPIGVYAARVTGPIAESILFEGDIKRWLNGLDEPTTNAAGEPVPFGSPFGGWLIVMLPIAAMIVAALMAYVVNPRIRAISGEWTRQKHGFMEVAKVLAGCAATVLEAIILAAMLSAVADPRGSFMDQYEQRNALVVGIFMGFAVIPIIYTISEDAISTVPDHLRSASLGAGATPWQTAIRVIIPTAASGLFSAVMIGLGRAVGETMIVLMAAGNTPVMEWNIFNGLRSLSANIAVEMPEAVKGSTHYRTLFLAALTLFAMTFLLNTLAETVRQKFRKRAFQL